MQRGAPAACAVVLSLLFMIWPAPTGSPAAVALRDPFAVGLSRAPTPVTPGSDWPTYLGGPERDSAATGEQVIEPPGAAHLVVLWNYSAPAPIQSQPVEAGGTLYFGSQDGFEYAVNATSGAFLWKSFLGQDVNDSGCAPHVLGVTSTASVVGSTVYVDGGYPYLYALSTANGSVEWRSPIGGSTSLGFYDWSSPLIFQGFAYVGIASDCDHPLVAAGLVKVSLADHSEVAYFNTSQPAVAGSSIWGSPSINPATNTVYVTTGNPLGSTPTNYSESVLALNASTLALEASWQVPAAAGPGDSDFGVTPTLFTPTGGFPMVTAANKNGYLYAFYQGNLTLAWQQRICCQQDEDDHFSTAWGGGYVYAVGAETSIAGITFNSSVRALDPTNGTVVWKDGFTQTSYYGYAAPLYVNGMLVVADGDSLILINARTGAVLAEYAVGGQTQAAASLARGELFVGTTDGSVLAMDVRLNVSASSAVANAATPLAVSFNATGTGGLPPYDFTWTFGDGSNATGPNVTHAYVDPGVYAVVVTVRDETGNMSSDRFYVTAALPVSPPKGPDLELAGIIGGALLLVLVGVLLSTRRGNGGTATGVPSSAEAGATPVQPSAPGGPANTDPKSEPSEPP